MSKAFTITFIVVLLYGWNLEHVWGQGTGTQFCFTAPQGPPGPKGTTGQPGSKGETGSCECDTEEVNELRQRLNTLAGKFSASVCGAGMKNGNIRDNQISTSTPWSANAPLIHRPQLARLDSLSNADGGCWAAGGKIIGEWIQIDFGTPTLITGVVTQGRRVSYQQWITSFKIGYGDSLNSITNIQEYGGGDKVFQGNTATNSHKVNMFPAPITARYFRLIVVTYHGWASLRMDFITC